MAWSSYAHLPNSKDEYWFILSNLQDGMSIKKVDELIAVQKNKKSVQHHYRSNLARIGFFKVAQNNIILNYDADKLALDKDYLLTIFRDVLKKNTEKEVQIVSDIILQLHSYELKLIVDELSLRYPLIEYNSFIRWIRPLIALMKYADILSIKRRVKGLSYARYLQEAYLKIASSFTEAVPLENLENEIKKFDSSLNLVSVLNNVIGDYNNKFKIELLMMPNWATKNKSYKMNQDVYTHIKIKDDLLKEE